MSLSKNWQECTIIGFDTETTGKYPLEAEICEIAAVKWQNGQVIDEFQSLVRPSHQMSDFVIGIHGITNEMVQTAPTIDTVIKEFHHFIESSFLVAHHAPFDMGFVTNEFEKYSLALPTYPMLCSSLISRKAFPGSPNHRLQTLIRHLSVTQGVAHRALDDSRACLSVALKCFEKIGLDKSIEDILNYQEVPLIWNHYSITQLKENLEFKNLLSAIEQKQSVELVYSGGSKPNQSRIVKPVGFVRTYKGDFLVAYDKEYMERSGDNMPKRYFASKITKVIPIN